MSRLKNMFTSNESSAKKTDQKAKRPERTTSEAPASREAPALALQKVQSSKAGGPAGSKMGS